jgi:hypothetical protein
MKPPAYIALPGKDCFALEDDYRFKVGALDVWIPAGFAWNGASIPQALWSVMGGRYEPETAQASLEHDWFYLFHGVSRAQADQHFFTRCREMGEPLFKARAMYWALRMFGGTHWPTSTEDKEQIAEIRKMISIREDKDNFLATMLTASER